MSVQNSAQSGQELRRGFIGYAASVIRPGPALGYDLVRAYLGIGLFVRGVLFVSQPDLVLGYLQDVHSWFLPYALVHFVAVAHLCGGVMLGIGLATRLAAEGFGVLALDLRGHGESVGAIGPDFAPMVQDVRAARRFLATRADVIQSRVGIVGASLGANLAAIEAAIRGDAVGAA